MWLWNRKALRRRSKIREETIWYERRGGERESKERFER
jgi:hypothetical protein